MLPVYYVAARDRVAAEYAAERICAPHIQTVADMVPGTQLYLHVEDSRYVLMQQSLRGKPLKISLSPLDSPYFRARCEGKRGKELLPQSFGKMCAEGASIADCTAGSGADGILLAARGAYVTLYEREAVTALLLEQTLADAAADKGFAQVVSRVTLVQEDAVLHACTPESRYDGYYLDPMFLKDNSAKSAKQMACIQLFSDNRSDADGERLLQSARMSQAHRTVVKRPIKSDYIGKCRPNRQYKSRNIRFDVYDHI